MSEMPASGSAPSGPADIVIGRDGSDARPGSLVDEVRLLRAVLDGTTDSVFVKDREGRYLVINTAGASYVGRTVGEIIGRQDVDIFPEPTGQQIMEHDRSVLTGGQRHAFEVVLPFGEAPRVFLSTKTPYRDARGEIVGLIGISRDITERKRIEAALRETAETLRAIVEASPAPIVALDREGRVRMWNPAAERVFGWTAAEVLGLPNPVVPSEERGGFTDHYRRLMAGETLAALEVRRRRKDGALIDVSIWTTALHDKEGAVTGAMGVMVDLTERKEAERAVRASEERLARILESAMDAIVTIDEQRTIRLFNNAAENVFRCPSAEALGQAFDRFASPALREMLARCAAAFAQHRVKKRYVWVPGGLQAVRADGEVFPIEATISHVETGRQRLLTIILRDVNDRQQAEEELRKLQLENLYLQEEMRTSFGDEEMVGQSEAIQAVLRAVEQVSPTDATTLITGETGTGKELVARAIHARSGRSRRTLVKVNCAALPSGLVESELFGHEKGAFTGALARKVGRFEMADGGSIFLDEIGDLPLELQAKLLRVLQEGEFERVGGVETLQVDVRVIAATNRDLEQAVAEGRFREDLYYRLNVFPLRVPPLRERREDLPLLARHFAWQHALRMGKRIERITDETLATLAEYHWPGNVRELQNVIERAAIVSAGPTLELAGWPPTSPRSETAETTVTLEEVERRHILRVLERTRWRVSGKQGAAELLGLKPTTLESRMKRLGIARSQ